jgi:hypothetical protein
VGPRIFKLAIVITAGAVAAGCSGAIQADHASQGRLSAANRNKVACEYVLATYSPLAQGYPKGYRASDLPRKVAAASSSALRHELSKMQAADASNELPEIPLVADEMVKTCDQLGLSEVDRITPGRATNGTAG